MKIDLYRDTPDGPAFLTTIVAATPDDGEFLWTPADERHRRSAPTACASRCRGSANPLVLDRSQEPFTVPEDGTDYFVDDRSNADDEYTPRGIGDNRHTGKTRDARRSRTRPTCCASMT